MNAPMPPEEALLPWVPLSTQPERIGVFQVRNAARNQSDLWFSFWDGTRWHGAWDSPAAAFKWARHPVAGSVFGEWEWRGFASDPLEGSV